MMPPVPKVSSGIVTSSSESPVKFPVTGTETKKRSTFFYVYPKSRKYDELISFGERFCLELPRTVIVKHTYLI